jgi:hypothetical protein
LPQRSCAFGLACACAGRDGAGTGKIAGTVVDKKTGRALAFVNVAVPEAKTGALSDSKGEFLIGNVPPARTRCARQFTGYGAETVAGVTVTAGDDDRSRSDEPRSSSSTEKTVIVKGDRPLIDTKSGGTTARSGRGHREPGPAEPADVVAQQAGVSSENNQIRVRGGRADETTFIIDGVTTATRSRARAPPAAINARSVAEVNVIASGFSARYGQALSGIVDVKLKEGGQKFEAASRRRAATGSPSTTTASDLGPDWITERLRSIGSTWRARRRSCIDLSTDFSNTYLPNIQDQPGRPRLKSGYEDSFLGMKFKYSPNFFMPSEENTWRGLYKWTWKPTARTSSTSLQQAHLVRPGLQPPPARRPRRPVDAYPWLFETASTTRRR